MPEYGVDNMIVNISFCKQNTNLIILTRQMKLYSLKLNTGTITPIKVSIEFPVFIVDDPETNDDDGFAYEQSIKQLYNDHYTVFYKEDYYDKHKSINCTNEDNDICYYTITYRNNGSMILLEIDTHLPIISTCKAYSIHKTGQEIDTFISCCMSVHRDKLYCYVRPSDPTDRDSQSYISTIDLNYIKKEIQDIFGYDSKHLQISDDMFEDRKKDQELQKVS